MRTLKTLAASAALLLVAGTANAGLIISIAAVDFSPGVDELLVTMQITGTEGVSSIGYDLVFSGTGTAAFNVATPSIPGATADCPTADPPGPPGPPPCQLTELGPPNADGTNYNLATTGTGPTGGTYSIGFQLLSDGSFGGSANLANLVAFNNAGGAITDITIIPIPEPTTAALLGLGLFGLALGGRRR